MPKDGEYVVEVRAHSEGGDGAVAQVRISGRWHIHQAVPIGLFYYGSLCIEFCMYTVVYSTVCCFCVTDSQQATLDMESV